MMKDKKVYWWAVVNKENYPLKINGPLAIYDTRQEARKLKSKNKKVIKVLIKEV